jgi:cobalt-zinc-cadmium efflux system membrane fusion protein
MNEHTNPTPPVTQPSRPADSTPPPPEQNPTSNALGSRARLRAYLQENRRARLLALGIGLLAVLVLVWWFVAKTGEPLWDEATIEVGDHASEEEGAHGEEEGGEFVVLTASEVEEFGIDVRTAGPGTLPVEKELPGEVRANEDRYAHVTPRVAGVVKSVRASVGSAVRAGQTMAVVESRELADLKADYLAALEREELARTSFEREERLYEQEITSQADYLEARQEQAEARIRTRSARQKLIALGFSDSYIQTLPQEGERSLVSYPLTAPISGRVVEKHIVAGEAVEADTDAFEVADLSTVWVDLSVYQRDLGVVREGQEVVIDAGPNVPRTRGTISYVRPIVGEETRTAIARVVATNPDGLLRPGQFVTGLIAVDEAEVAIVVPETAVIDVEGTPSVFVQTGEGFTSGGSFAFEARPVEVGDRTADLVVITSGLSAGERYVAVGAFALKAELGKSEMAGGHGH